MGGNRNAHNFAIRQWVDDGRRHYNQHDDRGYSNSSNNNTSNSKNFGGGRQKYTGRGGQHFQNNSSGSRGNYRGQGNFRGGGGRKNLQDEDIQMFDGKSKHQQMYSQTRGFRRAKKSRGGGGGGMRFNSNFGWHRVVVKQGAQHSVETVLSTIKELVDDPFVPILPEIEGQNIVFYLEKNSNIARAIHNLSGRLKIGNNNRIFINCDEMPPPNRKFSPPQLEIIKAVMGERYSIEMKRLNMKHFHNDKKLSDNLIFCPLYRRNCMLIVVEIIKANCPVVEDIDFSMNQLCSSSEFAELKNFENLKHLSLENNRFRTVQILQDLKGLPITELTLEGNPLCDKFKDQDSYINAVREIFPKVERLDRMELAKPIVFEVEDDSSMPPTRSSYFCSEEVKGVVIQFLQQYFQVFESDDRKLLEAAYTEDAMLSVSANFPETGFAAKYTKWIERENRNMKKVTVTDRRHKLLHKGRAAVSQLFMQMPKLTHDPNSFVIDIPIATSCLMHVVLTGVFKQVVDKNPPFRNFMKSMIIVPVGAGFCISNEELYINAATVEQIRKAFKVSGPPAAETAPVPSVAPQPPQIVAAPELDPVQLELIKQFSMNSKMLPEYCKMCLENNNWDFAKAGEMFLNLQKENKIPAEYFGVPV